MSDDLFTVLCFVGAWGAVLALSLGLSATFFDSDGYWRWKK